MKKLKIISIVLGIFIALLVAVGVIFSTIYEDKVKAYIINQVNNSINTKIDVKEVEFSVFKKFPYASLEFKQVTAEEVNKKAKKETLFSAQSVYLQFNIFDILNENYLIKKIHVEDGMINAKIDKYGNDNYHFWKESKDENEEQLSLELENLTFQSVNFYVLNEYKNIDMDIEIIGVSLSGNFSNDKFTLDTEARLMVNKINENGKPLLKSKKVLINTSLAVNQITQLYHIEKGEISFQDLKFSLAGNITNKEVGVDLDIQSKGNDLKIEELFSLFPPQQKEALSAYKSEGIITYTSTIKGELSLKNSPSFNADFSIKNGKVTERSSNQSFTNLNVSGNFSNGEKNNSNSSKLVLKELTANFGAGRISGNYIITDFNNPYIVFNTNATLDLATAKGFFKWDTLETANGTLELNLSYNGYVKELNNIKANELRKLNATGTAKLVGANLKLVGQEKSFKNINGSFKFNNNDVFIDTLKFNTNNSFFELDGKFKNLLAFLFVEGEHLAVKTNLYSSRLVLDEFLTNSKEDSKDGNYTLRLPANISLDFNAKVDTFQFRKFSATNFYGHINLDDRVLTATDVSFNAMRGTVKGNIAIDDSDENEILITSKVNTTEIDIYQLFYQFENFGQDYIKAENLKGISTTSIEFASVWDKQLNVNKDKIYVLADLNITNGELIDYKPILAMSKFIEVKELERIKFKTLTTKIEINDQIIHLPVTDIKSSAIDLTISGTHTFNNAIDYRFKLLLNDVLWKKAKNKKKENSEFGYIADDGLGKTTLFLLMKGTVDNYKITYDTKGLKESFKEDLKEEKQTLKKILNNEFGWFKKDSTIKQDNTPKDNGFQMEWEEDDEPETPNNKTQKTKSEKTKKKKGLGKFIDKIAKPEEEEYDNSGKF
jgi:hypothetical protein